MNRGALEAQGKLKAHGARARLAKKTGMRLDKVSRIVNGRRLPNATERAVFEDELGIGWRLWDEGVEDAA